MACIVLHNFLVDYEDDSVWQLAERELQQEQQEDSCLEDDGIDHQLGFESERQAGAEWRDRMRGYFNVYQA
ncbi:hypothetical protein L873DRAFT_1870948 [Choiromyces venosus 120613-1]|uniref:Uncharacterized protein n=1 Tax=Choiromyces venosus 120613-1 TaxID=1336337 RepID=A0A3N4K089_9PEZI|nr:hypothetical protein L873DRAFT_1870948 [Choiromyces venosus 120613-1]